MQWPDVALGDLLRIKHGFAFKGEYFQPKGQQLVLTPGNFKIGGGLQQRPGKERFYSGPYPQEFRLEPGDLLVAMTDLTQNSPILGSPVIIPSDGVFLHNQRLGKVEISHAGRLDRGFAYFLFVSDAVRSQLRGSATGSTVRHTAPTRIYSARVQLPPITVQRKIAAVLSAYDDLIENNARRIKVLEEMVQRIYREWFVEFRYPGHESVAVVGGSRDSREPIPDGWRWCELRELADEVCVGVEPASVDPSTPYVGLEHMPQRSVALADWGVAADAGSRKYVFRAGDILFGKIRPYFHKVVVPAVDGICSTDAIVVRTRGEGVEGLVRAVVTSDAFVREAVQSSQGTKMPRANWRVMEQYAVAVPAGPLLKQFDTFMANFVSAVHGYVAANRNLRISRDLLLPRLISGEVDVTDLNIVTTEDVA